VAAAIAALCFVCGLAAVSTGAWLIAPPAGLIVGGSLTALVAALFARGSWDSSTES
jgi:hypothetical protein